jgi:uncharacterized membrane protein (UPF0127 family)
MKRIKEFGILLFFILLSVAIFPTPKNQLVCDSPTFHEEKIRIKKNILNVEVAKSDCQMAVGLMDREALTSDGMLFVFDKETIPSFWMKNTLIPLSIAFIDIKGKIVDIQDMEVSDRLDFLKPTYSPKVNVKYALEVNRGFFDKKNIQINDLVKIP